MESYVKVLIDDISVVYKTIKNNGEFVVCLPNEYKEIFLEETSKHPLQYNINYITIEELISRIKFKYDENAIYYLMDKYHYSYNASQAFLSNLFYSSLIEDDLQKVKYIKEIYNELYKHNLLFFDSLFKETLKYKKLIIVGYNKIKDEYAKVLNDFFKNNKISSYIHYIFNDCEMNNLKLYECNNEEEELHLILDQISSLINKGITLDKIKVLGINNIERAKLLFSLYKIPVNINEDNNFVYYQLFNDILQNNIDYNSLNDDELNIYQQAINCLNKLNLDEKENRKIVEEIVLNKLKELKIKKVKKENAVEILSFNIYLDKYIYKDCYLFVCGVNEGVLPKIIKDEDYFKDEVKKNNSITTSYQENSHSKKELIKLLKNCCYVCASYSLFGDSQLYPSSIIKELNIDIIKYQDRYSLYSDNYNKLLLIRYFDLMAKYGVVTDHLIDLYNTYAMDDYLKYDNTFKVKDNKQYITNIRECYKDNIKLSYSSMDIYNKCPFVYYIERVLKLKKFENSFPIFIGNLYHHVLEKVFSNNDYNESYIDMLISDYLESEKDNFNLKHKELFLLDRLVKELKEVIKVIKEQNAYISYQNGLFEKKISINGQLKHHDFETNYEFNGIIDKLYYQEVKVNGITNTYVSLIDYKTGTVNIKLDLIDYGLSMQLPVYIYLLKESKLFDNIKIGGIFIQNILNKDYKTEKSNSLEMEELYLRERYNSLKFDGYLVSDNGGFDSTEKNSLIIKGLKKTKEGSFYATSKVLSCEEVDKVYNITKSIIDNTYKMILDGYFPIEPKLIDKRYNSCEFCKYNDLCFKTYKDVKRISLRGDKNA